jgi:hypothetical protein
MLSRISPSSRWMSPKFAMICVTEDSNESSVASSAALRSVERPETSAASSSWKFAEMTGAEG